ncbi:ABC transporter ATP-binding protein [Salinicoccus halodurans]|uniref:ABC transporter n=1 Tax=Salinicoccus halodurans TaxID=407035 RepID=A0A0F7D4Y8_9STAP|nr:ABC transporter ATP-binding protein [Salinicoccus halodurans]AKG75060.1 ABC transporter [Salinicoccus halodurans]SFK65253.1 ABC-2 type transport system ATP-binding protein [Salinicoccus halodurans]
MSKTLQLDKVSLNIKKDRILEDITIKMETGKVYGLIGRNGAGKTSILSLIASFRKPSSGTLAIDGVDLYENADLMDKVDFLYEVDYSDEYDSPRKMFEMTKRYKEGFDMDYALELMEGFGADADKPLHKMSKGQQAATNASIGLASNSPITIFDEVTNGMDAPSREYFYKQVLAAREKMTRIFILSTHIVSEMDYLFDEVIMIHQGRVKLQEPLDVLLERGFRVSGPEEKVAQFTDGMDLLSTERLGPIRSDMVLGRLSEEQLKEIDRLYLDISTVKLQDLFIRLTEEKEEERG